MPRGRVRRAAPREVLAQDLDYDAPQAEVVVVDDAVALEDVITPADWRKGALLNVRNMGDAYVVTLYPEEFRADNPERALRFTNPALCQDFVSKWYARESFDPRAR